MVHSFPLLLLRVVSYLLIFCGLAKDVTLAFTNKPLAALPQVQRAQDLILSFLAAPSESAASSLSRMPEPACIRSPVPSLNRLLSGGWPVGQLSSVSSTRGVGKTVRVILQQKLLLF